MAAPTQRDPAIEGLITTLARIVRRVCAVPESGRPSPPDAEPGGARPDPPPTLVPQPGRAAPGSR